MSDDSDARSQGFLFALAIIALLLLGGGAAFWWQARQTATLRAEREMALVAMESARAEADARRAAEELRATRNTAMAEALLARCEEALRSEDVSKAALALDEAVSRAAEGGIGPTSPRLSRLRSDFEVLRDLDQIDNLRWTAIDGRRPDPEMLANRLAAAFARLGITPETPPEDAARRINESAIRDRLFGGLDLWLVWSPSPAVLAILRKADPDPFRDAVRTAIQANDRARLTELLARPEAVDQPPRFVVTIAEYRGLPTERKREILMQALRRRPGDFTVLMLLGSLEAGDGRDRTAEQVRWYQAALALRPANTTGWINLGAALQQTGDPAGAIAAFREAIRLDPRNAQAHANLGFALQQKRDVDGAIACFREAIQLDPKSARAHAALGLALTHKGDFITARETLREAIRLDPNDPKAHQHLGVVLHKMGDLAGAIAALRQAIRLDPKDAASHAGLGEVLRAKGDPEGALACFREAARLDPKRYESLLKPSPAVAPPPRPAKP
jgi:tetratricopeptide (TPR) repeat protein